MAKVAYKYLGAFETDLLERLDRIEAWQNTVGGTLNLVLTQGARIMAEIDDLTAEVAAVKTVEDGAVLAINRLLDAVNGQVQTATDLAALKVAIAATTARLKGDVVPLADAIASVPPAA